MTPRPFTDDDRQRLRELHAQGKTLTAIARELGRSKSMISRYADEMGLSFDRTQTAAATVAKVVDAKSRRAQLALDLLADAERLRAQLWSSCSIYNFGGRDNTYNEVRVDQPPFADKLKIMQAAAVAVDRSLRLDEYDSGNAGAAGSLLGSLFADLQRKHGTGDPPSDG